MELLEGPAAAESADADPTLDAAYRTLDRVLGSITHADNKALIALTFQGAIIAGLILVATPLKDIVTRHGFWEIASVVALALFFVCLCISTLKLFETISPRFVPAKSPDHVSELFYFAGIAGMPGDVYLARLQQLDRAQIHEAVASITHVNAQIAVQKFKNLHLAYRGLGLQLILYVLIVLISVLPHSL